MLTIQVVSDLHIEFWAKKEKFNFIKPTAPILALLGDICCCGADDDFDVFKRFIMEVLDQYETIIFVPGNHEYYYNPAKNAIAVTYNNTLQGVDDRIKSFFKATSPKLHFLNNSTLKIISGKTTYSLIGSTLWSWIPEDQRDNITNNMNDYRYIQWSEEKKIRPLTANDIANLHLKNYKYIRSQIIKSKKLGHKIIVFTHHKPYLSDDYNPASIDVAYQSDLSGLFEYPVVFWGYGHTHIADSSVKGKTWVYSNPKGYPKQKTKYNKEAVIKI